MTLMTVACRAPRKKGIVASRLKEMYILRLEFHFIVDVPTCTCDKYRS